MVWLVVAVAAFLATTACGSAESGSRANATQTCDYVTFARFSGIRYVPSGTNDSLGGVKLGPAYAEVERQLSRETGTCQDYTVSDGDATDVSVGTRFYEVEGYQPQFLLATEIGLWEADYAPGARTGGDVLDIGGRVNRIAIVSASANPVALGAIDEPTAIGALFDDILDAPIVAATDQRGSFLRYRLRFEMDDGLVFERLYRPDTGELWNGIMLPDTARAIISDAVAR